MFTWICPKCGGEVSPSYSECPRCNPRKPQEQAEAAVADPMPSIPVPPPPPFAPLPFAPPPPAAPQPLPTQPLPTQSAPVRTPDPLVTAPLAVGQLSYPPQQSSPPAPAYYPPPPQQPPARTISPILVATGAALGIVALLAVLYIYVLPHSGESAGAVPSATAALENPAPGGTAARSTHHLGKYIEVSGVRLQESAGGKVRIDFVVVNHSAALLPKLKMEVRIQSGGRDYFIIPVDLPSIGPFESKDLSTSVATTLKPYELPDWQLVRPAFTLQD